jgi:hypothetical protein
LAIQSIKYTLISGLFPKQSNLRLRYGSETPGARQAIFDRQRRIYGNELRFRSDAATNAFNGTEAAAATMQVLSDTLMSVGVEKLLGGEKDL